jgi:hypothetical protein
VAGQTNTLYIVNFTNPHLTLPERLGVAMSLLTSNVRDQMRRNGRTYAAGLLKFEPSDLTRLRVPKAGKILAGWEVYQRAVRALTEGNELACERIADSCLLER